MNAMSQIEDMGMTVRLLQQLAGAGLDTIRVGEQAERIEVSLYRASGVAGEEIVQVGTPVDTEHVGADLVQDADQVCGVVGVVDRRYTKRGQMLEDPLQPGQGDGDEVSQ